MQAGRDGTKADLICAASGTSGGVFTIVCHCPGLTGMCNVPQCSSSSAGLHLPKAVPHGWTVSQGRHQLTYSDRWIAIGSGAGTMLRDSRPGGLIISFSGRVARQTKKPDELPAHCFGKGNRSPQTSSLQAAAKRWEARRIRTYNASTLPGRSGLRVGPAPSSDKACNKPELASSLSSFAPKRPADPAATGGFYAIC